LCCGRGSYAIKATSAAAVHGPVSRPVSVGLAAITVTLRMDVGCE
jgi:hypothetical protein